MDGTGVAVIDANASVLAAPAGGGATLRVNNGNAANGGGGEDHGDGDGNGSDEGDGDEFRYPWQPPDAGRGIRACLGTVSHLIDLWTQLIFQMVQNGLGGSFSSPPTSCSS